MSILTVDGIYKSFGDNKVLSGATLKIEEPGIYALVGPNGSGKTTLFNIISNLLKPEDGEITVMGKPNTDPAIFKEATFLKDNRVLYEYMSGLDHLSFIRFAQKLPKESVREIIDLIGIRDFVLKKVGTYSLGMKQKLLLAMAMISKPKLMILDEPLNGLDPTSVIKVRQLLTQMAKEDTAILISSHTLSEIDLMTDEIFFLKDGEIIEENFDKGKEPDYLFTLQSEEDCINAENLHIGKIEGGILSLSSEKYNIKEMLKILHINDIKFTDINRKHYGAEDRYRAIFPAEVGDEKETEDIA